MAQKVSSDQFIEMLLGLLDNLKEALEMPPEKIKNVDNVVYTYGVFRRFSSSFFVFLNCLFNRMNLSPDQFEKSGFQGITEQAMIYGIIDRSEAVLFDELGSAYGRLLYNGPDSETDDEDLLDSLPQLEALMRKIILTPINQGKERKKDVGADSINSS